MAEKQILSSVGWSMVGTWTRAIISIVAFIWLARLLAPSDFGVFALTMLIVGAGALLVRGPLSEALIQDQTASQAFIGATFWATLALSAVLTGCLAILAAPLAALFGVEALAQTVPALAALCLILGLASVPAALIMRDLRFDLLNKIETLAALVGASVAVALASMGAGWWSLLAGEAANALARTIGVWITHPITPGLPRPAGWPKVAALNWGSAGTWSLKFVSQQIPRGIVGAGLGAATLGLFVFAERLFERAAGLLLQPIGAVALSAVSRTQSDRSALHEILRKGFQAASLLCAPAFLGLAAIAPVLIPLVFGSKWQDAVLPAQIILLIGLRGALEAYTISILRGLGHQGTPVVLLAIEVVALGGILPFVIPFGLTAICAAILCVNLALVPLGMVLVSRASGFSVGDQMKASGPAVLAACAMAALVSWTLWASQGAVLDAARLPLSVGVGVVSFIGFYRVLAPATARSMVETARTWLGAARQRAS
ncbi:MAG: oligosaccharide flippase family protein [Pseudomonadota bacterium]